MKQTNQTSQGSALVVEKLSVLLGNYNVYYTNLKNLHWNIQGDKFFELHPLYESYGDEISEMIDQVAERILQIGSAPENPMKHYIEQASVVAVGEERNWHKGMSSVLSTLLILLGKLRVVYQLALEENDLATASIVKGHIKSFEKKAWMVDAYLAE